MLKSLTSNGNHTIRLLEELVVLAIIAFGVAQMYAGGFYARAIEGFHWYSIIIFLVILLAYVGRDKIGIVFLVPIVVTYYCLHEAIFNAFFLSYHMFEKPFMATATWYQEMLAIAIVTPIFLMAAVKRGNRLLRTHKWSIVYLASWVCLIVLHLVWVGSGFPVSADVYDIFGTNTPSPLANDFELATNLVFAFAYYVTFSFKKTIAEPAVVKV